MTSLGDEDPVVHRVQDALARRGRTLLGPRVAVEDALAQLPSEPTA